MATLLKNHRRDNFDDDLEKALNRVDFFRIFHNMSLRFGFAHFGILQLCTEGDPCLLSNRLVLHDLPSGVAEEYDKRHRLAECVILTNLQKSAIPSVWKADDPESTQGTGLLDGLGFSILMCVPVAGTNGARFAVMFMGNGEAIGQHAHFELFHDAVCAFDYFYRQVLTTKVGIGLTPRETEILRWISHGKTASEIALIVSVSEHTVNSHTATILKKLDVVNRTQMVAKAIREQIIR